MQTSAEVYPEHEKLHKVAEQSQVIGEFLEWLSDQKYTLAKWSKDGYELMPTHPDIQKLLAKYFKIDLNKIEEEKQTMLYTLRKK
jgi:hypothetical protein